VGHGEEILERAERKLMMAATGCPMMGSKCRITA
jgi:hypothetical protein